MAKLLCASEKGFTLIELTVVLIILGLLAAIAIPQLNTNIAKKQLSKVAASNIIRSCKQCEALGYDCVQVDDVISIPSSTGTPIIKNIRKFGCIDSGNNIFYPIEIGDFMIDFVSGQKGGLQFLIGDKNGNNIFCVDDARYPGLIIDMDQKATNATRFQDTCALIQTN